MVESELKKSVGLMSTVVFALALAFLPCTAFSATGEGAGGSEIPSGDATGELKDAAVAPRAFNPIGLRDPFRSFILEQRAVEGEKAKKPRSYLETVDISQLELIAVVVASKDSWAMVRDAKGIGYVVKTGTPVGIDGGLVHDIRPGEVIIRSSHRDAQGRIVERETAKRLVE